MRSQRYLGNHEQEEEAWSKQSDQSRSTLIGIVKYCEMVVGILLPTYFVTLLPGPKVDASIQQLNIKAGMRPGARLILYL